LRPIGDAFDAADYVAWRKGFVQQTTAKYNDCRNLFGQTHGSVSIWDDRQPECAVIDAALRWSNLLRPHQMSDLIIEIISEYVEDNA
jgi:hypothetical protein